MGTAYLFGTDGTSNGQKNNPKATSEVIKLLSVSFEERDEKWVDDFLLNIADATLGLAEPEVAVHNDGFAYMQFIHPKQKNVKKNLSIREQLNNILSQGFGISIQSSIGRADWILSYGDLVNLYLNNEFYTEESIFSKNIETVQIDQGDNLLVGQPSENILPGFLRQQLSEYLQYAGIKNPKVMLIARNYEDENLVSQDLVFNLTPKQFRNKKEYNEVMSAIEWFLPKHYSFLGVDEMTIQNGFKAL